MGTTLIKALYKPRPERWPQGSVRFSLRTLFVLVTIFGVWLGVQMKWIKDRHEAIKWLVGRGTKISYIDETTEAPWSLRLFGEKGQAGIVLFPKEINDARAYSVDEFKSLFPEAQVKRLDEAAPKIESLRLRRRHPRPQ